jgi:hypothetical protein
MAREWTDEEVKAEIAAAVKIVAEDREKATYANLHSKYGDKEGNPNSPPKKEEGAPPSPENMPKKKSLWWGESAEEKEEK